MTGWLSHCARAFRPLTAVLLLVSLLPAPALVESALSAPAKCDMACCARKAHPSCPHHGARAAAQEKRTGPAWKSSGTCPRNCTNSTEAQRSFAIDRLGGMEQWVPVAAFVPGSPAGRVRYANPLGYSLRQRPPPTFETSAFAFPAGV